MHSLTADPEPGDRQLLFVNVCLYMCLYRPLAEQSKHPIFLLHLADSKDVFTSVSSYANVSHFSGISVRVPVFCMHCTTFNVQFSFHWNSGIKRVKAKVRGLD